MDKPIGVYWGRFNPPHKGHIVTIKKLKRGVGTLIIVIGSSQFKNEKRNPFSGTERKRMLIAYLKEDGIKNVKVITHKDGKSYFWAFDKLIRKCKPNFFFLPDNEKPELLKLAKTKFKGRVKVVTFRRTGKLSSTRLRDAIATDKSWKHLTGKSTAKLILSFNGINRIKRTYKAGMSNEGLKRLKARIKKHKKILDKINAENVVADVRFDRKSR